MNQSFAPDLKSQYHAFPAATLPLRADGMGSTSQDQRSPPDFSMQQHFHGELDFAQPPDELSSTHSSYLACPLFLVLHLIRTLHLLKIKAVFKLNYFLKKTG